MTSPIPILSLQCGKAGPFRGSDEPSAIGKAPVTGPVEVRRLGLVGDEQADLAVHGGPDKAIHHYPFWRDRIGDHPLLDEYGAFGENVATHGLTEDTVCIGDRYRFGTATVEVSQGRQPCWKLDHRFGGLAVSAAMVKARRAGWYYRVLEEGKALAGDDMTLLERPHPQWTIARTFGLLIAGDHRRDRDALETLGELDVLAEPWKARRAKLLGGA
ncbi:MOSC domain-containing protein [Novosphingobium malaysiense]|uniref:Molybdenum cofactor biosysynthesis protein n=1 Tax=Novosphingobium malaysiense TaxID=1348853 RepID=A0A0B1ZER1_9SPHN|nr:MOSC domain-containing protein [Novosphingobium malaysiense]KHK89529.1 molybdenum cofactor biosysynthesis protein [Novosphingobium malaysiense]